MNINLNIPISFLERFVKAVEQLAADYRTVHANELYEAEFKQKPLDKSVGRTYYQSDKAIYEEELKAKAKKVEEYGEESL